MQALPVGQYQFSLNVSKQARQSSTDVVLTIRDAVFPLVTIRVCQSFCHPDQ